jgi:hypothetical protein
MPKIFQYINKNQIFSYVSLLLTIIIFSPITVFAAEKVSIDIYGIHLANFDLQGVSLPLITLIIALVDGFNPCAMSILLFLISILLEIKESWKRWYLGSVFILTSAFSYFLFLTSWLKINEFVGLIPATRALIAIAAFIVGAWTLNKWWEERNQDAGCKVSEQEQSKKMFSKVKQALGQKSLLFATIGIAALAFSVNLFELLCSAALPATYTNILAGSNLNDISKIGYLIFYVAIFMLDDLAIFTITMLTLQSTGITNKYNSWVKLISGIIMLLLSFWIGLEVLQGFNIL